MMNITGKSVKAIALGKMGEDSGIPAPLLEFTEGDIARITFHNKLDTETSIHWHGLLVPNNQDGVPHVTNPPIAANSTYTYEFPIKQSGTYWYHSHTGLQEQRGVYGPIVIHPKQENLQYDHEQVLVLSDWTNRNPQEIMHILKHS
jgi:FtsP/CotA-like multicopper oxidase with cupredoxin domain